mmetsp:Transcript_13784/g.20175  ORF Transcript_13784/g.20175 Transcript_13784/m.20175 type:complete len:122 (-) Transcript_13784:48-413(-)
MNKKNKRGNRNTKKPKQRNQTPENVSGKKPRGNPLERPPLSKPNLNQMTLDEIVDFINDEAKKKTQSKSSTQESSVCSEGSPDKEIEEFRKRIESVKPFKTRLKPKISSEWLGKLRKTLPK